MAWNVFIPQLLVMAVVTYLIRMLPLAAIRGKVKSVFLQSFLYYVPYAVLAAMTLPSILYSTSNLISAVFGMIAAVILAYRNYGLTLVALGAVFVVFVTEQLMIIL